MNTKTIEQLAREAGINASVGSTDRNGAYQPNVNALGRSVPIEWLERFAALAYAAGQRDMREAAADCVENADTPDCGGWDASGIAEAIRALSIEGEKT